MVWDALVNQARLKPNNGLKNKRILVVDAGSPTGCIAIQVCIFLLKLKDYFLHMCVFLNVEF